MATLVVQDDDGTKTTANSYISVTDADTYFSDRNNSTWSAATTENKTFALIKAWQYLDYNFNFKGCRLTTTQNTEWPRSYAYTSCGCAIEGIPVNLTYAQCEYAVRALSEELLQDITYDDNKLIKRSKDKVGPIETEREYDGYIITRSYPAADVLLKDLLKISGMLERG
jgi:hypothetical protein